MREFLVAVYQEVEFMRKCEYHMEIRGIYDLGPSFVYPYLLIDGLAVGTAAVPAGIAMELQIPAVRTLGDVAAELAGFAVEDSL